MKLTWARGIQGMVLLALISTAAGGQDVRNFVNTGNQHYQANDFSEALNRYEQALTENPRAYRARFNQGNVYYRLDDLEHALKAFREVAAETKDMSLVAKAKYNLGNTHFQQGLKQQDSDLQKALDAMRDSITQWRSALELDPENVNAARNIEVARLKIKDILDQINKQQDPNQPQQQDPNQAQQQDPQQQPQSGDDQHQQDPAGQDPNQPQDPNESQDPNQAQESPPPEQPEPEEPQQPQQDMTAQAILDKEQKQKDERRQQQVVRRRPVDKDW